MKQLYNILFFLTALTAFGQSEYGVVQIDSSSYAIKVTEELPNGQNNISWLPNNGYLDSTQVVSELLQLALANSTYAARTEARSYRYNRQFRNLLLLTNAIDTSYYDFTWSVYADQLAQDRYFLFVDGTRIEATPVVNVVGRLVLKTDAGNTILRVENSQAFTLINSPDIGANAYIYLTEQDSRRKIYRGVADNGKQIALVRL